MSAPVNWRTRVDGPRGASSALQVSLGAALDYAARVMLEHARFGVTAIDVTREQGGSAQAVFSARLLGDAWDTTRATDENP